MKITAPEYRSYYAFWVPRNWNYRIPSVSGPVLLLAGAFLLLCGEVSASVALVREGKPELTVLVDASLLPLDRPPMPGQRTERGEESMDGLSEQRRAVTELVKYVKLISGAELKVAAAKSGARGCYVGLSSSFPWLNHDVRSLGAEGFTIQAEDGNIHLVARDPLGVRHAVSTVLREQGCRWFFPGKVWEEIPQQATVHVTSTFRQTPSFPMGRTVWYGFGTYPQPGKDQAEWNYHNRMGSSAPVSIGHTEY